MLMCSPADDSERRGAIFSEPQGLQTAHDSLNDAIAVPSWKPDAEAEESAWHEAEEDTR